jgi:hypothetical protein
MASDGRIAYCVIDMTKVTSTCHGARVAVPWMLTGVLASGCGSDGSAAQTPAPLAGAGGSPTAMASTGSAAGSAGSGGASDGAAAAGMGGAPSAGIAGSSSLGGSEGLPVPVGISGASGIAGSGASEPEPEPTPPDPRPFFSFFAASQAGLYGLPAGEFAPAPSPTDGYGGNFGGLAGADEICTMLARAANPGDTKTWRAFLSTSGFDGGQRVDAIDRVGPGPWYNYNGLLLAETVEDLLPSGNNGRPSGDAELANMFTDENGEDIRPSQNIDNHDTLTGSGPDGRLFDDGEGGNVATCQDWTSSTLRGEEGNMFGGGGQIPVGHSWPRTNNNGRNWISDHTINGCEPGADVDGGAGAPAGDFRVGAGGGFGGIYCFALGAVAPE